MPKGSGPGSRTCERPRSTTLRRNAYLRSDALPPAVVERGRSPLWSPAGRHGVMTGWRCDGRPGLSERITPVTVSRTTTNRPGHGECPPKVRWTSWGERGGIPRATGRMPTDLLPPSTGSPPPSVLLPPSENLLSPSTHVSPPSEDRGPRAGSPSAGMTERRGVSQWRVCVLRIVRLLVGSSTSTMPARPVRKLYRDLRGPFPLRVAWSF